MIKDIIPAAIKKYKSIMIADVGALKGKKPEDLPCVVLIDENNFLSEWN